VLFGTRMQYKIGKAIQNVTAAVFRPRDSMACSKASIDGNGRRMVNPTNGVMKPKIPKERENVIERISVVHWRRRLARSC